MRNILLLIALAQGAHFMEQVRETNKASKFKERRMKRMQRVAAIRGLTKPNYRLPATLAKPVLAVEEFKGYRSPAVVPVNSDI